MRVHVRISVRDKRAAADAARGAGAEPAVYDGGPVYWTDLVVAASAPITDLHDAFGKRFAWTTEDSQSGWQAPRLLLAAHAKRRGAPLFSASVGPLVTPRNVALAIADGRADIGSARQLCARAPPPARARARGQAARDRAHASHAHPAARRSARNGLVGRRARPRCALCRWQVRTKLHSRANRCCFRDSPPSRRRPTTRSSRMRAVPMRLAIPASRESMSKRVD